MRVLLVPTAQSLSRRRPLPPGPAAVIDVLRATTTIVAALAAGALAVEPVATVAAARRRAHSLGASVLLAGERRGDPLPGFDLGNSPIEASTQGPGRTIVLTTTNGTLACARLVAQGGGLPERPVLAAALTNAPAAAKTLERLAAAMGAAAVTLVAAGQAGHPAAEDLLAAGAIASHLPRAWERDDLTLVAEWAWRDRAGAARAALAASPHGATLLGQGYADDIAFAAEVGTSVLVPRLERGDGGEARFVAAGA